MPDSSTSRAGTSPALEASLQRVLEMTAATTCTPGCYGCAGCMPYTGFSDEFFDDDETIEVDAFDDDEEEPDSEITAETVTWDDAKADIECAWMIIDADDMLNLGDPNKWTYVSTGPGGKGWPTDRDAVRADDVRVLKYDPVPEFVAHHCPTAEFDERQAERDRASGRRAVTPLKHLQRYRRILERVLRMDKVQDFEESDDCTLGPADCNLAATDSRHRHPDMSEFCPESADTCTIPLRVFEAHYHPGQREVLVARLALTPDDSLARMKAYQAFDEVAKELYDRAKVTRDYTEYEAYVASSENPEHWVPEHWVNVPAMNRRKSRWGIRPRAFARSQHVPTRRSNTQPCLKTRTVKGSGRPHADTPARGKIQAERRTRNVPHHRPGQFVPDKTPAGIQPTRSTNRPFDRVLEVPMLGRQAIMY